MTTLGRLAGVVAACTLLSGCGSTTTTATVDPDKAEALVTKAAREQVGLRPKSVSCPEGVEGRKGTTFTCTVTGRDGTTAKVPGEVRDADKGTIFVGMPIVNAGKLETTMVAFLRKQVGPSAKVDCPDVVTLTKGAQFTCKATAGQGQTADVRATIDSTNGAAGDITYKVVPTG